MKKLKDTGCPKGKIEVNILIIGLGYHAKRIYCPIIKKEGKTFNSKIRAVVDIEEKRDDIEEYISNNLNKDIETVFISDKERTYRRINSQIEKKIDKIVEEHKINAVVISTEPLVHMMYARYALKKGLNVLMDKPISTKENISTNLSLAKEILKDFHELIALKKKAEKKFGPIVFDLMAQRRFHPAFQKVKELIKEVHEETNCPVTSIQSFHSDGQWRTPIEIVEQDYHPYNQGYGKLSHSGYHSLDLVPWLLEAAESKDKQYDEVEIVSQAVRPRDFMEQINLKDYKSLFPDYDNYLNISNDEIKKKVKKFGEIDVFSTIAFKHAGHNVTLGSINLVHNGFAQRNWVTAQEKDLYKGNGRVRHESHYIEQGPFQAISFVSYQGKEICQDNINSSYNVGGEYHLDIHIFRNDKMFPKWKNYEKLSVKDLNVNIMKGYSRGHQEDARRSCVVGFIEQIQDPKLKKCEMSIEDHQRGVVLMSGMYQSLCKHFKGKNSQIKLDF